MFIQSLINRNSIDLALEWPLFILYSVINKSIFWSKYLDLSHQTFDLFTQQYYIVTQMTHPRRVWRGWGLCVIISVSTRDDGQLQTGDAVHCRVRLVRPLITASAGEWRKYETRSHKQRSNNRA